MYFKVYRIRVDIENCSYLLTSKPLDDYSDDYFDFHKDRSDWKGVDLYSYNLKDNFASFNRFRSELCFKEDVFSSLENSLINFGQFLPANVERKGKAYIFNVKFYLDCMTKESNFSTDVYFFEKLKIRVPIFKLKKVPFGPVFCTSGLLEPDMEFYHIYHKHNMTGLQFIEINGLK
jgi:hypothetical protein